ncbi:beta-lactamase-like protein [Lipomyces oligophaga]|uniref:beta-lactamase-like protein n=1 Tax=Lipomyces oligophaga TaxID=45792 RepID=UPI0034D01793
MPFSLELPICKTCGVQFGSDAPPEICPICDDPRQYLPPTGQAWTSLRQLSEEGHRNEIQPVDRDNVPGLYSIITVPKVAIGQRALLMVRPNQGNILWDCVSFIDDSTVKQINNLGGIAAIVISHPHFYSSHVEWGQAFNCPVYLSAPDKKWVMRPGVDEVQKFYSDSITFTKDGANDFVKAVIVGGHFPGSAVCNWNGKHLFVADSISVVLSGLGRRERLPGTTSFTFMWSYPNFIPLDPDSIHGIWKAIKNLSFDTVYGGWTGLDVLYEAKARVLESMKIVVKRMGFTDHLLLTEVV